MDSNAFAELLTRKGRQLGIAPKLLYFSLVELARQKEAGTLREEGSTEVEGTIQMRYISAKFAEMERFIQMQLQSTNPEAVKGARMALEDQPREELIANPALGRMLYGLIGSQPVKKYHTICLIKTVEEIRDIKARHGIRTLDAIILHLCKNDLKQAIDFALKYPDITLN